MNYKEEMELTHFGKLGMKWGIRRSTNPDGSLTDKGKQKISAKYKKLVVKATKDVAKTSTRRSIAAYNKTTIDYNNGKIEKFNKKNDSNSPKYLEKYAKQFAKDLTTKYSQMTLSELTKNKNYKKAQKLVDKYSMTSFDSLAKENTEVNARVLKKGAA